MPCETCTDGYLCVDASAGPCAALTTDGLELYLDASNPESYAGTGNTWTDLSAGLPDVPRASIGSE